MRVPFELCRTPLLALVSEVRDPGGMAGTFWPEQGLSVKCGRDGVVPPTQEVGCVIVMENVVEVMVCISVLSRLCCALFVDFRLSVKICVLEQHNGAVVGVSLPLA